MASDETQARPWYREPLVWMLIAIPGSAVVMAAIMIPLAVTSSDGLVSDDYYREGLRINRSLERDDRAEALGIELRQFAVGDGRIEATLTAADPAALPWQLKLSLTHATRDDHDVEIQLTQIQDGYYEAPAPQLAPGNWNIELAAEDWRVLGRHRALMEPATGAD